MITQKNPHPEGSEVVAQMCSVKKVFLEILQKFTAKHLENSFFLVASGYIGQIFTNHLVRLRVTETKNEEILDRKLNFSVQCN